MSVTLTLQPAGGQLPLIPRASLQRPALFAACVFLSVVKSLSIFFALFVFLKTLRSVKVCVVKFDIQCIVIGSRVVFMLSSAEMQSPLQHLQAERGCCPTGAPLSLLLAAWLLVEAAWSRAEKHSYHTRSLGRNLRANCTAKRNTTTSRSRLSVCSASSSLQLFIIFILHFVHIAQGCF